MIDDLVELGWLKRSNTNDFVMDLDPRICGRQVGADEGDRQRVIHRAETHDRRFKDGGKVSGGRRPIGARFAWGQS